MSGWVGDRWAHNRSALSKKKKVCSFQQSKPGLLVPNQSSHWQHYVQNASTVMKTGWGCSRVQCQDNSVWDDVTRRRRKCTVGSFRICILLQKFGSKKKGSWAVGDPGILFGGGGWFNKFSWGHRERGSGGCSPLVTGSGGSCNLVQEISFHIVEFS